VFGRRFAFRGRHRYSGHMPSSSQRKAANLRSWHVIIIRSRGEYLGSVEAPDRERAASLAVPAFAAEDPAKAEANKAEEQKKKENEQIERAYKDTLKKTTREQPVKKASVPKRK
jgi:flagellar biosynthesis/type III secretory pathway protein FliH